jgi:orotate phosphoribosyltransferase
LAKETSILYNFFLLDCELPIAHARLAACNTEAVSIMTITEVIDAALWMHEIPESQAYHLKNWLRGQLIIPEENQHGGIE